MNLTLSSPNSSKYIITRLTPDREIEVLGGVISYNDETKVMVRQRFNGRLEPIETFEETTDGCMVHEPTPNAAGFLGVVEHEDARFFHYMEAAIAAYKGAQ
jgi:hypothetical protein